MEKNLQYSSKGFTLIETFVAVTILLIAILGPMSLFSKAIRDGIYARNQVTAFYLAQEGLELAINVVKTNKLSGTYWLQDLETSCNNTCTIDIDEDGIISISSGGGDLYLDDTTHYTHEDSGNTGTVFSRVITVKPILFDTFNNPPLTYGAIVTSIVKWTDRPDLNSVSKDRETKLETIIYDQQ